MSAPGARVNKRTPQEAVDWGLAQIGGPTIWHGLCDHFVAQCYGWGNSGYGSALQQWLAMPQHNKDHNPPLGALVFWRSIPYGHVALSCGDGTVISTDILVPGGVSRVPIDTVTHKWGIAYLGWTPAVFNGSGSAPDVTGPGSTLPDGGGTTTALGPDGQPLPPSAGYTGLTAAFANLGSRSFWLRVALGFIGAMLIVIGVAVMYGKSSLPIPIPV